MDDYNDLLCLNCLSSQVLPTQGLGSMQPQLP
jgi:hypothetical protein